ncbi:MAG: RNB domain-containing ribonuclease [Thermosynechococcaceae cyanobacterium]
MRFSTIYPAAAIAEAHEIALPNTLWHRPQVQGFTIDGPDSLDLDDAIWIESTDHGAILSIHIADVAELIPIGSMLDKAAIARTQTRYFGKGNDPMLPRVLSENKLSLLEGQDRPTLTVQIALDGEVEIERVDLFESWLASCKQFAYKEADAILTDTTSAFQATLQMAHVWSNRLHQHRQATGAIGGIATATGDWLDENGSLMTSAEGRYNSHLIIQEFMILANRAVAQWLADADLPALYRNHTARAIAPNRAAMYQAMLTLGSTTAVRQQLSNWLNRAEYSPVLIGHFALNLNAYCHFTSPIRRLADLVNHRIVKAKLKGQTLPYRQTDLEQLSGHIAETTKCYEEASGEYFKAQRKKLYKLQIQCAEALDKLTDKAFGQLLKHAVSEQNLDPIRSELLARITQGTLMVQDLYVLLFRCADPELRQLTYSHLRDRVQDAPSIIAIAANQEANWDGFNYVELASRQPFTTWLEVAFAGATWTTVHPAENPRKQGSRHGACLAWIEAYIQNTLVGPDQRIQPMTVASEPIESVPVVVAAWDEEPKPIFIHPILAEPIQEGQNCVSLLNELCQGLRWASPAYDFEAEDGGFCCLCKVGALAEQATGTGWAMKKQRAKDLAARQVLEQLRSGALEKWTEASL